MVPFGLGMLLALYLARHHPGTSRLAFVLFLGVAMSITAFPVLARILTDRRLAATPIGGLALACAALAMTGVLLRLIYPPERAREDIAAPEACEGVKT